MSTKYEYYDSGDDGFEDVKGIVWKAQTFTPSTAHKITSVKLKVFRFNIPGTITVGVRATDANGHPTGSDICSGTTDGDTLTTNAAGEWREITLGDGYTLSTSTKYAIVVRAPLAGRYDYLRWRRDGSDPSYAGGCREDSSDSGSNWGSNTSCDFMFEDWGEPISVGRSYGLIIG